MAKRRLSETQVLSILEDWELGNTMQGIADVHGINRRTVYGIVKGRSYPEVKKIHQEKKERLHETSTRPLRELLTELREAHRPCCLIFPESRRTD